MKIKAPLLLFLVSISAIAFGQTCTSNPTTISASMNFSDITWTSSGSAVCPPGASFTGNIAIKIGGGVTLTMDEDVTISGNFNLTNNGTSTLLIPAGVTVHVINNMGDALNNNVIYHVDGALVVDGTLSGANGNAFEGNGTISGGTLDVKNNASCGDPCPVYGGFDNCAPGNAPEVCDAALPVKLLYFSTRVVDTSIELKWATSMEEDFYKFTVQRSKDGLTFGDIADVKGRGFNIYEIESEYSFTDEAPLLGRNYYRLKAVDLDESFEYFPVKMAELHGSKKIAVYPNPGSGEVITFRTNFNASEADRVVLIDPLGVEIFNARVSQSQNSIALQNTLRPGVYMLRYISDGFEQTTRVVIRN